MSDPLDSPPPAVSPAEAEALVRALWGIAARAQPIACERDANFRLDSGHVLKLSNPAEPPQDTNFQTEALLWVAARDPGLPLPRVVVARDGRHEVPVPLRDGRVSVARLLTWVEGVPLARVPFAPGMEAGIGRMLARLTRALAGYAHPAAGHYLQWDIRHTPGLRPMLVPGQEDLAAEIAGFEARVTPVLPRLRAQVVHNDMNHHNILVDPQDSARIAGVIDLGDMVHTPLICDVAVAAAYLVADEPDPVARVGRMLAAYHAVLPLRPEEVALLRDLIVARLVTSVVISESRARMYPENAAYILRNTPGVRAALARFAPLPRAEVGARLRAALSPTAPSGSAGA
ncbi:phosphotransferase [Paenirhodobacter sp.]|uniref:phosphotransferase n=1 Tax=Paenirhodobacter sp. TaxID=1965326 RepID=UPI003B41221E